MTGDSGPAWPRIRLLHAILRHIPFDGWSPAAMAAGASDAGLTQSDLRRHFPGGPRAVFEFFSSWADTQMVASLGAAKIGSRPVHERIREAVSMRIGIIEPWREAVHRGVAFAALPPNAPLAARCLYRTVDSMWYATGDRSADFSFYTKRASLAGIFAATMMYWLADQSEGYGDTWAFLDRRLADMGRVRRVRADLARLAGALS